MVQSRIINQLTPFDLAFHCWEKFGSAPQMRVDGEIEQTEN